MKCISITNTTMQDMWYKQVTHWKQFNEIVLITEISQNTTLCVEQRVQETLNPSGQFNVHFQVKLLHAFFIYHNHISDHTH